MKTSSQKVHRSKDTHSENLYREFTNQCFWKWLHATSNQTIGIAHYAQTRFLAGEQQFYCRTLTETLTETLHAQDTQSLKWHTVPHRTLSPLQDTWSLTGHSVPYRTLSSLQKTQPLIGHSVLNRTLSSLQKTQPLTGHSVLFKTLSSLQKTQPLTGHSVPYRTLSS